MPTSVSTRSFFCCLNVLLLLLLSFVVMSEAAREAAPRNKTPLFLTVDGGTESIRACCYNASGQTVGPVCAVPYPTHHPKPGWAEQHPSDWDQAFCQAVQTVTQSIAKNFDATCEIVALCIDTTCCSVVALNQTYQPVRPCLLWMDQRAATQAARILATADEAVRINSNGHGPLSAEWMLPKAAWLHENEYEETWQQTAVICEYQDYINCQLTGKMVASACNTATRWHYHDNRPPVSLYNKVGLSDLVDKLPRESVPMGTVLGNVTAKMAARLGLSPSVVVVQGGPDAFVGMVGLGCVQPGQVCLITGSSHLHCAVTAHATTARGIWGAYQGAPLPHLSFAEGGQSSTGSILRWAKTKLFSNKNNDDELSYQQLDDEAEAIQPGADGLVVQETFQGARTPVTDPLARGAIVGMTLSHTRAHVWRALLEAVCFGTKACIDGLEAAGHDCNQIIMAGGATNSPLWLQLHADVTGKPVVVCENPNAPLLGCAILAAVGVGVHKTIDEAVSAMVRQKKRIEPNPERSAVYSVLYKNVYSQLASAVKPIMHAQAAYSTETVLRNIQGGAQQTSDIVDPALSVTIQQPDVTPSVTVSPSLLACDWGAMGREVSRCIEAGAHRLHVDVFDGVFLQSPDAFTFGPAMVRTIRAHTTATLDLHMCVQDPARFVDTMAAVTGGYNATFIFQCEAVPDLEQATRLAQRIKASGMACGVSINPETPLSTIQQLLETGLIKVVDLLAVNPGFGGQQFQTEMVLPKIVNLFNWRRNKTLPFDIMIDGGVNGETASWVCEAGADILVSGSFLFRHERGLRVGMEELLLP